jgi:hypothetical protein
MLSFRLFVTSAVVSLLAIASAFAEAPARVRGTITAIDEGSMTVKARDGRIFMLKTGPDTMYACVVPSNLDEIKVNDFVGSAVKGSPSSMVAVELAIIPDSMRAGRIGYYGWDPLPDPTAMQPTGTYATGMTNGRVSKLSPAAPKLTNTNMTNGIVSAEKGGTAGRTLTVTYDGGSKSLHITVPPNAPIVRYVLADRSTAFIGSTVFIKTNPGDRAGLVTVGKGVTPPM